MPELPRSDKSYWREAYPKSTYPALRENLDVDIVVIGTGITGLTSAYLLKKSGYSVAVLDKNTVGSGTTTRTTGKVTSQHNLVYHDLAKRLGKQTARTYGEANQFAVEQIERIVREQKISCDWQRDDNYVYTNDPRSVQLFKDEAKVASELGLPASFETKTPLPFNIKASVKFANQAKIHSQKYLLGLAKAINGSGSFVFEHSNVIGIRDGSPGHVRTSKASLTAKHIIVATNVPTLPLMARAGYCALEYPKESYIIAGKLGKELSGMYISPDKHHYSIFPVQDNNERLLLIGGEGHISGLRGSTTARYQKLASYAEKNFGITEIAYRWSDRDYMSYDGVPLIGKLYPWSKNLYVGTAFNKWGLSGGTVAAMILRDLIIGKENSWTGVFNSNRTKPIRSIPRVAAKYLRLR